MFEKKNTACDSPFDWTRPLPDVYRRLARTAVGYGGKKINPLGKHGALLLPHMLRHALLE